jgi:hypothetical protein
MWSLPFAAQKKRRHDAQVTPPLAGNYFKERALNNIWDKS